MAETDEAPAMACAINIGPKQRQRRLVVGIIGFVLGDAAAALIIGLHAPHVARLAVLLPFWVGAIGVFQARAKT
jgi:hypothetical protein